MYLGVSLTCEVEWDGHIQEIVSKADRTLGLLGQILQNWQIHLLMNFYLITLDNCVSVWDSHLPIDIESLEMSRREPVGFDTQDNVTSMLNELGWHSLQDSRRDIRLTLWYNSISLQSQWRISLPKWFYVSEPDMI